MPAYNNVGPKTPWKGSATEIIGKHKIANSEGKGHKIMEVECDNSLLSLEGEFCLCKPTNINCQANTANTLFLRDSTIAGKTQGTLPYLRLIIRLSGPQPPFSMLMGKYLYGRTHESLLRSEIHNNELGGGGEIKLK